MASKVKIAIWDQRMFDLMDYAIAHKINKVESVNDFIKSIGIATRSTLNQVKEGKQGFRPANFKKAGDVFGVSMDWFYGYTTQMKRSTINKTPKELILEALRLMDEKKSSGK